MKSRWRRLWRLAMEPNDLPMIKAAGLGIAYHAKPKVNEKTEVTIRHADLMGVFCILSGSLNQK